MRIVSLPLVLTKISLAVALTFGVSNTTFAQHGGGGHGGGGGGGGHAGGGSHAGGGGHVSGGGGHTGGGGHVRSGGGGNAHVGGGGSAHINSHGNGNMRAGGQAQIYNGRGNGQNGNANHGNGNGHEGNNNSYGNGQNHNGRNPGSQGRNGLSQIYRGNYGNQGGYRYGTGYRGNLYGSYGLGAGYGQYGYSYFPWYGGLGLYGGIGGLNRTFGNGIYGSGYYNNGYSGGYSNNSGTTTMYQQPEQSVQSQEPIEDYVPQVNETNALLAATSSGNAVLGITIDHQYAAAAVIRDVTPGSSAEKAGLRAGDMIASIDDRQMQSPSDVVNTISGMQPGDQIHIQFVRPIPRSEVRAAAPEVQPGAAEASPTSGSLAPPAPPTPAVDPAS